MSQAAGQPSAKPGSRTAKREPGSRTAKRVCQAAAARQAAATNREPGSSLKWSACHVRGRVRSHAEHAVEERTRRWKRQRGREGCYTPMPYGACDCRHCIRHDADAREHAGARGEQGAAYLVDDDTQLNRSGVERLTLGRHLIYS